MKKLKIITCITTSILIITLIIISIYSVSLKKELDNYDKLSNSCSTEENNQNDNQDNNNELTNQKELTYDCSFTRTYNIVNTLEGYRSEVLELSYVVIDAFQDHAARTHVIPTKLKNNLENGKTYEFTYTVKGTGIINDIEDIYHRIVATTTYEENKEDAYKEPTLKVYLSIKETNKLGLAQLQQPICEGK